MKKLFLIILGIITALYGILILQVGSGTIFWMMWELIASFFWFCAFCIHKDIFTLHKNIQRILRVVLSIVMIVLLGFCVMIANKFSSVGGTNLNYIIVLGAQVREDGPSVVLKYRLDKAVEYLNENPETLCIVSGGQGINEPFTEAKGMFDYLVKNGISEERILLEDASTNTVENIQYSKNFLKEPYNGVGIITNDFHVFRAVQIAKRQELENVCGIAANSNVLYLPNNVLRECCGILKDWVAGNI